MRGDGAGRPDIDPAEPSRWARLFADLDAELAAGEAAELRGEAADRTRRETGRLTLTDRLRGAEGHELSVRLAGHGELPGRLLGVGPDWLLVRERGRSEALLPLSAVLAVSGLGQATRAEEAGKVAARLDFRYALRGLARDRAPVRLLLADGAELSGTVDRVGADYVELAEHAAGEPRRAGAVRQVRAVPLSGISAVRRS